MSDLFTPIEEFIELTDGEDALASEVMHNLNLLRDWQVALEVPTGGFGVAWHGDWSTIYTPFHSAASVILQDSSDYYAATTVEDALSEIATTGYMKFVGYSHSDTAASCTVTVPADTAKTAIVAFLSCTLQTTGASAAQDSHVALTLKVGAGSAHALSDAANPDYRFERYISNSTTSDIQAPMSLQMVLTTAILATNSYITSIDFEVDNILTATAPYGTDSADTNGNYTLLVFAI